MQEGRGVNGEDVNIVGVDLPSDPFRASSNLLIHRYRGPPSPTGEGIILCMLNTAAASHRPTVLELCRGREGLSPVF